MAEKKRAWHRAPWILKAIGVFKLLKATLLLIVSLGVFGFRLGFLHELAQDLLERLSSYPDNGNGPHHIVLALVERLLTLQPGKLTWVGVAAGVYCGLYLAEGIGLLRDRLWAEWLTITTTAGFIPLELYEIQRHVTAHKIVILVLNLVILGYLIYRLKQRHRETLDFRAKEASEAAAQQVQPRAQA